VSHDGQPIRQRDGGNERVVGADRLTCGLQRCSDDPIAVRSNIVERHELNREKKRQRLRLRVIGDQHDDIDVARKPHFCANGDREAADQCETAA